MTQQPTDQPDRTRRCPYCEATIAATVRKCRHCGEWVGDPNDHSIVELTSGEMTPRSGEVVDPPTSISGESPAGSPQQINVGQPLHHSQHVHINQPSGEPSTSQQPSGTSVHVNVNTPQAAAPVYGPRFAPPPKESAAFAIVTLIFYILLVTWPIAAILNIIGLITGPRRGCFTAMFFVCLCGGCFASIVTAIIMYAIDPNAAQNFNF